jgi:Methyltransferase FkbM domain
VRSLRLKSSNGHGLCGHIAARLAYTMILPDPASPSWSQTGEDRIVFYLFDGIGSASNLTYADLGAAFPSGHNNTYLFYTLGGSGLLVEADPSYLQSYQEVRPKDRVEQVAVVPARMRARGYIDFHRMKNPGWSTVSLEDVGVATKLQKGPVLEVLSVPCLTINELLGRHFPDGNIDILSIDLEGVDTELLGELDLSAFRPRVIIVENPLARTAAITGEFTRMEPRGPLYDKLSAIGYALFACTFVNYIFVHFDTLKRLRI